MNSDHDTTRSERRERRKRNQRKMRLHGTSVKTLHQIAQDKADKLRRKERNG